MSIAEYFQAREAEIIENIRQLVDIESPSYDVEGSRKVADWITKNYPEIQIERNLAEGYGEHLIIRAFHQSPVTNQSSTIFLLGHTDTVHPRGSHEKNPTRIEDDQFY